MTEIKYSNLLVVLRSVIETTIQDLNFILDESDFDALSQSVGHLCVETCPWTILEEIINQLVKVIVGYQVKGREFEKQLERKGRLSDRQHEEYLSVDVESNRLENEIKSCKAKILELQGIEQKLREQCAVNNTLVEELSGVENALATQVTENVRLQQGGKFYEAVGGD